MPNNYTALAAPAEFIEPLSLGLIGGVPFDNAAINGVTRALIDFGHKDSFVAAISTLPFAATIRNLVDLGSGASVGGSSTNVIALMDYLGSSGVYSVARSGSTTNGGQFNPSAAWRLTTTDYNFGFGCWMSLPATGYPTTGATLFGFIGSGSNTSTGCQYAIIANAPNSGVLQYVRAVVTNGTNQAVAEISGTALANLANGSLHHVYARADGDGTNMILRIYVDGVLAAESISIAFTGAITSTIARICGVPGGSSSFFGVAELRALDLKIARPRLDVFNAARSEWLTEDVIALEREAAYLGSIVSSP